MSEPVEQPTNAPTNKVLASTAGAAAATVIVYVCGQFGVEMDSVVAGSIVTVVAFVAGYFKRESAPTREDLKARVEGSK